MLKKYDNIRVQVSLSVDMCQRVDKLAYGLGVSRSALCSVLIGQGVLGFEKGVDMVENALSSGKFDDLIKAELN